VMLQSCSVAVEVVPGSSSETSITSSDGTQAVIRIKVEGDMDVPIKVEETAEPISFPPIKSEPVEVSYLSACPLTHTSVTCLCPLSDTCQLPVCAHCQYMSVTCLCPLSDMCQLPVCAHC
jgi:hypothetical protein